VHTASKALATIGNPRRVVSFRRSSYCLAQWESDQLQCRAFSFGNRNSRCVVTRSSLLPGKIPPYGFHTVLCTIMGRQDEDISGSFPSSLWILPDRLSVRGDFAWFLTNQDVYFS